MHTTGADRRLVAPCNELCLDCLLPADRRCPHNVPTVFALDEQLIDAAMARALHQDACRDHSLVAWIVWYDHPAHPGHFVAQLTTSSPLPYVLVGDTLAEVQGQLPPGLMRHHRQPEHAPEVVEMWLAA
jgi:hypothetical protein